MKTCENCGSKIVNTAKFCSICGQEIKLSLNRNNLKAQENALDDDDDFFAPVKFKNKKQPTNNPDIEEFVEDYEIIDESVELDDPFAFNSDYEQMEEEASQMEYVIDATGLLDKLSINEKMKETLYPILSPNIKGYRCIVTGNEGTRKDTAYDQLAEILFTMKKIKEPTYEYIPFGKMPTEFDVDKMYVIGDLTSAIERLFNLEDVSDEANNLQQQYVTYMERLLKASKDAYIFLDAIITQIKGFLSLNPKIKHIFSKQINFPDLSNDEIYDIFIDALPEYHKKQLPIAFKYEFVDYLKRNKRFFPFSNKELGLFLAQVSSQKPKFELPPEKYSASTLSEAFANIIGMQTVKSQIEELSLFLKARKDLEEAGASLPHFHLHMMFLGNPGVGKTTIARIIAKVLFDLGYIREDKLIEVTSKDLVGNGNQTGIKTNKAILSALGGVLFIDEAYSLSNNCGPAGAEAIANLIKAMEDYKNDLVVMFAGYTLEMNDFVKSNSGIASRIAYTFQFQDYNQEELLAIYCLKVGLANMFIDDAAFPLLRKAIEWGSRRDNFGNGRFIDKLFQRTLTKHATLNLPRKEILTLKKESIPTEEEIRETFGRFM